MSNNNSLAHRAAATTAVYSDEQIELITRTCAKDLSQLELGLFLYQCQRTGLDPLSRQIHAVKRSGKLVIQTGIDGYYLIADRTGLYAGSDDAVYTPEDGDFPIKATVTVYKLVNGQRQPFTRSARWKEYYPGKSSQSFMWEKMPFHMLGKCAAALALRAAFPQELSGVYTSEEMMQADHEEEQERPSPKALPNKPVESKPVQVTAEQAAELRLLFSKHDADVTLLLNKWQLSSLEQLLAVDFQKVKDAVLKKPLRQPGANSGDVAKSSPAPEDNGQSEDISQNQEEEIVF